MGTNQYPLDFDGDPISLVEAAFTEAREQQSPRNVKNTRFYKKYRGYIDMTGRNPDMSNMFIPKLFSLIESKVPRDIRALYSVRPYIPISAKRPEYQDEVDRPLEEYLDDLLYRASAFESLVSNDKIKVLFGTSFLEPLPYSEIVTEKRPIIQGGVRVGVEEIEVERLRLRVRDWAPWEIFADPFATNLTDPKACRYLIKLQITDRRQIVKLAEGGRYPNLDLDKLMGGGSNTAGGNMADHWGLTMLKELGLTYQNSEGDMGILMRFESPERYIDLWNGRMILSDGDNPWDHGLINLAKFNHITDPHTQNRFWGIGEAETIEPLCDSLNDTWDMTMDAHHYINQPMVVHDEKISGDALVRVPGNRIAINRGGSQEPIDHFIKEFPGGGLPPDHYTIAQRLEDYIDLTSHEHEPRRGEVTPGDETLGEISILKEAGDTTQELNVRLSEAGLAAFANLCFYHIAQFATPDDFAEVLGIETAQRMEYASPFDIPGGFNFQFKGSDKVANELIKQRNWKELTPLLLQIPNVLPGRLAAKVLDVFGENTADIEDMIIPDEVMMQMQQEQATQQQEDGERDYQRQKEMAGIKGGQPGGKYKENNAMQMAQESGREAAGGVN